MKASPEKKNVKSVQKQVEDMMANVNLHKPNYQSQEMITEFKYSPMTLDLPRINSANRRYYGDQHNWDVKAIEKWAPTHIVDQFDFLHHNPNAYILAPPMN